jgi:L-aminopeptidase/D-esterase-like protein
MTTVTVKQGDTSPIIQNTLTDADGNAVDVTGATIRFHMFDRRTGEESIDAAGAIVTATSGIVKYTWQAGDTATVGAYNYEWEVTYSDATVGTFPTSGYNLVIIEDDLA